MKKAKRILALTLCLLIFVFACPVVSAASAPKIILTNESAMPGKEVTVDISITNNPGIMAMTFSVVYDKDQFEYVSFSRGYISTPQCKDHSDKGYVVFSVCETSNKSNNGNIMSVTFKIKDNAVPDKYPITIGNHNYEKAGKKLDNCFANSSEEYIVPTVKAGSINVETECDETGHNYGGWSVKTEASCHSTGLETRVCAKCGKVEKKTIPISHEFEDEWTVDKAATPEEDGIMSRHCKKCDAVTDTITFTYEEVGGEDNEDTSSENSSNEDTSSGNSSNEDTSEDNSSDQDVSSDDSSSSDTEDNSSDNSSDKDTSDNNTTSDNTSSSTSGNKKPAINNTVGAKNPLSAVEGLEDYKNIKPETENSKPEDSSENSVDSDSVTTGKDSDKTGETDKSDDEEKDNDKPFFKTALGIIIVVLGGLLSLGILALGVILILQRRKSEE